MAHIVYPGMERLVLQILQALKDQRRALRGAIRSMHSKTSRDLPMPASPWISTVCPAAPPRQKPAVIERLHFSVAADEGGQMLLALVEAEFDRRAASSTCQTCVGSAKPLST